TAVVNELFKARAHLDIDFFRSVTSGNSTYYPLEDIEKIRQAYLAKNYSSIEDEGDGSLV
ncbi:hypothetical protein KY311_02700, partial [Candidatus Woesearchaeota archaeon]|nr:hypothetical protein [Candidatus Woesearchaeota archaeon]